MGKKEKKTKVDKKARVAAKTQKKTAQKAKKNSKKNADDSESDDQDIDAILEEYEKKVPELAQTLFINRTKTQDGREAGLFNTDFLATWNN